MCMRNLIAIFSPSHKNLLAFEKIVSNSLLFLNYFPISENIIEANIILKVDNGICLAKKYVGKILNLFLCKLPHLNFLSNLGEF